MSRPVYPALPLHVEGDEPAGDLLSTVGPWLVLALMTLVFATTFTWLSLARHFAYQSHAFDLANMDQAVWNTLHGHILRFTDMAVGPDVYTTRLAIHVEPFLILLAPLYIFHSGAATLLVVPAFVVASGAVPAYLLARLVLQRAWWALVFPAAYLLHPSLQNAILDDFHAVSLSAAFLLWALYFAWKSALLPFGIAAVLAGATKEEVGLTVALLGLVLLARGRTRAAAVTMVAGLGWFLICVAFIIPSFNPGGHSPYIDRYSYLGHGLSGVATGVVLHPATVLSVLTSPSRATYLSSLLHPLGFVPLIGLPVFLLSLPVLLINMLSNDSTMYSGFYQYSAEIIPVVTAATAIGIGWVARVAPPAARNGLTTVLCGLVLIASLVDTRRMGFSPLASGYVVPSAGRHQHIEDAALGMIGQRAPVAVADEMAPHVSQRTWLYLLPMTHPTNGPPASYVALDASVPSLPVRPSMLHEAASGALAHGFGVERATDGILVLKRGVPTKTLPASFFSFLFPRMGGQTALTIRWGPLQLSTFTIHPRSAQLTAARPDIGVETFWRVRHKLPTSTRISFYLSPVYQGRHPAYSGHWRRESESPAWIWLPLPRWPVGRTIRAVSLPLVPRTMSLGYVDVALRVEGLGRPHGEPSGSRVVGGPEMVRVGTIQVQP